MQSPSHGLLLEMYLMSQCDICSLKDKLEKNLAHLTVLVEALMVGALSTMKKLPIHILERVSRTQTFQMD